MSCDVEEIPAYNKRRQHNIMYLCNTWDERLTYDPYGVGGYM